MLVRDRPDPEAVTKTSRVAQVKHHLILTAQAKALRTEPPLGGVRNFRESGQRLCVQAEPRFPHSIHDIEALTKGVRTTNRKNSAAHPAELSMRNRSTPKMLPNNQDIPCGKLVGFRISHVVLTISIKAPPCLRPQAGFPY